VEKLPQEDSSRKQPFSIEEAEKQVWRAVDELEDAINTFNNTPGKRDEVRRADLASTLMSLLAQKYGITLS